MLLSSGSTRKASLYTSFLQLGEAFLRHEKLERVKTPKETFFSRPLYLQLLASAMVVLPVLVQAPWVRLYPYSACLFTLCLLSLGILIGEIWDEKLSPAGPLLIGVSGSWFCGCLFWGWLREYPIWHLPVESLALPIALIGLRTRWRVGAAFYLACLLGTALTDLMMLLTGVMVQWPLVVNAPLSEAPKLLYEAANQLLDPLSIALLLSAAVLIMLIARAMRLKASLDAYLRETWMVASSALTTTLLIDGLFLITALIQPQLSGLI